jgi:hypothetical protein
MKTSSGAAAQKMISTTVYPGGRDHLTDAKRTRRRRIDTSVGIQLLAVNGGVGN